MDHSADRKVIPVVEEQLDVGKSQRKTKVQVSKKLEEHEEEVSIPYFTEEVEIERVPFNRKVDQAPEARREGDSLILPVVEEVLVVSRQLILKEEVHIRMKRAELEHKETVRLRRDNVTVERIDLEDDNAV